MVAASQLVGHRFSRYQIVEKIGAGGMSEVYLAHDEQLDRDVAVKVLRRGQLAQGSARRRFRTEALALARLNHPSIETVHEFTTEEGIDFLVTEYVPGVGLEVKLASGPLSEQEILQLGEQLAAGLEAAHQQGIVHRDVKPGNLRITTDGRLKILDFGLASLNVPASEIAQTITRTKSPQIAGTLPYMAPEQLRGETVDNRSDIWGAGAVLYEMVTGRRPFEAQLSTALTDDIIHKPVTEPSLLKPGVSPKLQDVILKCLEKEPRNRYHSARELAFDLQHLRSSASVKTVAPPTTSELERSVNGTHAPHPLSGLRGWMITSSAAIVIIVALALWFRPTPLPKVVGSSQITSDGLPKGDLLTDGSRLYFIEVAAGHTVLSQVSTAGGEPAQIGTPFTNFRLGDVSPDGSELLLVPSFHGDFGLEAPLWKLPLPAGTPRRVGDIVTNAATWSHDGRWILYTHGHDLYLSSSNGSQPRKLATVPNSPLWARWSPKGDVIRFTDYDLQSNVTSLWEVASDGTGLHRLFVGLHDPPQECCGGWTPGGEYYLFQSGGNIWALRERAGFLRRVDRQPVQVTFGPLEFTDSLPSVSGEKLFVVGQQRRSEVVRYDPKANQFVPYMPGISAGQLDFSRDGEWVAYVAYPGGTLWRSRPDGSERQQITFAPLRAALPRWSPDGERIAFMASEAGKPWKIFVLSVADGHVRDVLPGQISIGDPTWSADGSSLAFGSVGVDANSPSTAIQQLDLRTNQLSVVPGSAGMFSPRWSPDGRFLVALANDSQKLMLYEIASRKWSTLATKAIGYPSWSRDSRYVFFDDTSFTEDPAFYRVKISDRSLERVASLKDTRQVVLEWPFGSWTGLAPDNSPLLQRDISTQEIYALDLQLP